MAYACIPGPLPGRNRSGSSRLLIRNSRHVPHTPLALTARRASLLLQGVAGTTGGTVLKPHEIKAELDKDVIGQQHAKRVLSVALFSHMQRTASWGADPARAVAAAGEVHRLHFTDKRAPPPPAAAAPLCAR